MRDRTESRSDPSLTWDVYESPIGPLTLSGGAAGLRGLRFPGKTPVPPGSARAPMPAVVEQLEAYFRGERRAFDLELDLRGTPFDRAVWRCLLDIPYGRTESYGELAARVDPGAFPPTSSPGSGPVRSAPPTAAIPSRSSSPAIG